LSKFLVEVGANDGLIASKSRDLIINHGWKGLLIEPIKFYYDKLLENYAGNSNVEFLNIGISTTEKQIKIYRIDPKYLLENHYGHGVSSLNRNHLGIKTLEQQFGKDAIIEEIINVCPLSKIFKERQINAVDLLIIDTEGHDYEVILSLDFETIKPKKIIYENKHLGEINHVCENFLKKLGYAVIRKGNDTFCDL